MKDFLKGFIYAGKGIAHCLKSERNMRIHLCFTVYMFAFLTLYDFFEISRVEYAVLLTVCALVLAIEALNTAIERTVNLVTDEENKIAGYAKDASAGAVLIAAIFSVIVGIVIMYQPEAFIKMAAYYKEHIVSLVILIFSIIASLIVIFLPKKGE